MPGRRIPVLDIDQAEPRAFALHDLERADMEPRNFAPLAGGRLANQGCLGPFLENDESMAQINATFMSQTDQAEQRVFDLDATGT